MTDVSTCVTVSVAGFDVTAPRLVVIVVVPAVTPVARPPEETVATPGADDSQLVGVVISQELPSDQCPVAENCSVPPAATDAAEGVTLMATNVPAVPVSVAVPVFPSNVAEMVVEPGETAIAIPVLAPTVPIDGFDDDHVESVVTSDVVPSE